MRTFKANKKRAVKDWHPADIIAALHKKGYSLRQLSIEYKYSGGSLRKALRQSWPKAEKIIAETLCLSPEEIWPERYAGRKSLQRLVVNPSLRCTVRHERSAA